MAVKVVRTETSASPSPARKKNGDSRAVTRIDIRTTAEIKALIEDAARSRHKTLTAYLLDILVPQAKGDIRRVQDISLDDSERDLFFAALIDPPPPNEALRALFAGKKQHRE